MDAGHCGSAYHASLARALDDRRRRVLRRGGRSLDATQAAIEVLEDDPLFNAGRGSAFDALGTERDGRRDHGWRDAGSGLGGRRSCDERIRLPWRAR